MKKSLMENLTEDQLIKYVKSIVPKMIQTIFKFGSEQYKNALVETEIAFESYIIRNYKKYSQIKTILYRDKPVSLKKHYVQTSFKYDHQEIIGRNIFSHFDNTKKNIIIGTAGAGKSIFMKRFFIDLIENKTSYIPILIELRLLKEENTYTTIYKYMYKILNVINKNFTKKQLNYSLKNGKLAILLDGFDEIDENARISIEKEILDFSNKYNENIYIITSRPDSSFNSWEEFHILQTNKLKKAEAIELISKIDYDEILKENFIKDLDNNLYKKHIDFTSNPLLLTMMLLTYEQHAKIPEKIHIFYNEAFSTLFNKHDALKQQFKRKTYTNLPIDDFKKIFSTFCILSFISNDYAFNEIKLLTSIKESIKFTDIQVNEKDFLNDLINTVCVILKDGNEYTFSHRSFQEYFAALFISNNSHWENIYSIINAVFYKISSSSVIHLLFDLNNNVFEKTFFIKKLSIMNNHLNKIDIDNNPYEYLQCFITDLRLNIMGTKIVYSPTIRHPFGDKISIEDVYKKLYSVELYAISELYDIPMLKKLSDIIKKNLEYKNTIKILFNETNISNIKNNPNKFIIILRTETFRRNSNNELNTLMKNNTKLIEDLKSFQKEISEIDNRIKAKCQFKQSNIKALFNKMN
jgi:hypothetical protein